MGDTGIPQLSPVDSGIVVVYLVILWLVAFWAGRRKQQGEDYLLAGRSLTLPAFVATLVSTWYGGILGVGEFGWRYGISTWLVFGVPYYLHAILFALFIAPRARRGLYINLPDQLERAYGRKTAIVGALILFVMILPAAYLLMLAVLLRMLLPIPHLAALILAAFFSTAYLWGGGFSAVVRTDKLQFILMFLGFILLAGFCLHELPLSGLITTLKQEAPDHLTWRGGNTTLYILLWYIVAAQTYIEPTFHQRCYAAKSESVARRGTLISVAVWLVFDMLTTLTALYSRALVPDLANPVAAYPALAVKILPLGLLGLFITGLLATVMSTLDSYTFLAAVTLGRDVIGRWRGRLEDRLADRWVKYSLVIVAVLTIILAAWKESAVDLWVALGSIGVPALLIPVVSSFWQRSVMSPRGARIAIPGAAAVSLAWTLIPLSGNVSAPLLGVEPLYPGLLFSLALYTLDRGIGTRK